MQWYIAQSRYLIQLLKNSVYLAFGYTIYKLKMAYSCENISRATFLRMLICADCARRCSTCGEFTIRNESLRNAWGHRVLSDRRAFPIRGPIRLILNSSSIYCVRFKYLARTSKLERGFLFNGTYIDYQNIIKGFHFYSLLYLSLFNLEFG